MKKKLNYWEFINCILGPDDSPKTKDLCPVAKDSQSNGRNDRFI